MSFTPEQITEILQIYFDNFVNQTYTGMRYVPIFGRRGESSIAWDNSEPYEPLTIVTYNDESYTSRQFVPAAAAITDTDYWVKTGAYNAQIAALQDALPIAQFDSVNTVKAYIDNGLGEIADVLPYNAFDSVNTVRGALNGRVRAFETVADMAAATDLAADMICHTNGFHTSGDGGAAFYEIKSTGTANAMDIIACQDSLLAHLVITEPYIIIEQLGAVGDGSTDDSLIFDNAVTIANDKNIKIVLLNNSYNFKTANSSNFASIIGNESILKFDSQTFAYGKELTLNNITIQHDYAETSLNISISAFLYPSINSETVTIKNVKFDCVNASDTKRGKIFLRCISDQVTINNVLINGSVRGIVLNNDGVIKYNGICINNLIVKNSQTAIDIEGYESSVDYSGYIENVTLTNIKLINNAQQATNYTTTTGSDCILINNVKNLTIENIYSDYAIERALYLVNINNATINNVISNNGEGLKIVGTNLTELDPLLSGIIYSSDITIDNLMVNDPSQKYCMTFYECKNITCNGITFYNSSTDSYYGIGLTGHIDNVRISNVRGQNAGRGLFYIYETATKVTQITNVFINDVLYDNPVNTGSYNAIRIEGINAGFATNISISDCIFNPSKAKYRAASPCSGLISADHATLLTIKNCECNDIKTLGTGITIDASCTYVTILGEIKALFGGNTSPLPDFSATSCDLYIITEMTRNSYIAKTHAQIANSSSSALSNKFVGTIEFGGVLGVNNQVIVPKTVNNFWVEIVATGGYYQGYCIAGTLTDVTEIGTFTSTLTVTYDSTNGLMIANTSANNRVSGILRYQM